jgi:hypothetical protein
MHTNFWSEDHVEDSIKLDLRQSRCGSVANRPTEFYVTTSCMLQTCAAFHTITAFC